MDNCLKACSLCVQAVMYVLLKEKKKNHFKTYLTCLQVTLHCTAPYKSFFPGVCSKTVKITLTYKVIRLFSENGGVVEDNYVLWIDNIKC